MELISVIVPVYNVEEYLERCVNSIRHQTYDNLEIILVDDGSPDNCGQMCDNFAHEDKRIKVIHKENGGLGLARNSGLAIASGTYVAFIDSDDWIGKTQIEKQYQIAKEMKADIVIGGHTSVSQDGTQQVHKVLLPKSSYKGTAEIKELILEMIAPSPEQKQDVIVESSTCMNLYKMDIILQNGLRFGSEREAVAEDQIFNMDFLYYAQCAIVSNDADYFYFQNYRSTSRKYSPERFRRTINYYHILGQRTAGYGIFEGAELRIARSYLMKIRVAIKHILKAAIPRKQKMTEIRNILEHDVTGNVLKIYPIHTFVPAMQLLMYLMKARNVLGVYCLMQLREGIGRKGIIKIVLKQFGIGK